MRKKVRKIALQKKVALQEVLHGSLCSDVMRHQTPRLTRSDSYVMSHFI